MIHILWLPLTATLLVILWQQVVIKRLRRRPSVILSASPGRELAEEYAYFMKRYAAALAEHGIRIPGMSAVYEEDEKKMAHKHEAKNDDSDVGTGQYL